MSIRIDGHESHAGLVLARFERNGADDSDFVAVVWDPVAERIDTVGYASTRDGGSGRADVDAPMDVCLAARAYVIEAYVSHWADAYRRTIVEGQTVRSVTTRGKAYGLTGTVTDVMRSRYENAYQRRYDPQYIARVDGVWVPTHRLLVTSEPDYAQLRADADAESRDRNAVVRLIWDRERPVTPPLAASPDKQWT